MSARGSKLSLIGRVLFGGAAGAYLASLSVLSHYSRPFRNGVVTTGYVFVRLLSQHGDSTILLKPWQAALFHVLEITAVACLLMCGGVWYLHQKTAR